MNLNDAYILGMINARGGSRDVPRKNLRPLMGKPLIAYSIEVGRAVPYIDRVIVSTEDEEIARVARSFGADIPFVRPAALASDTALQIETIIHGVKRLEETGSRIDIVVLLQPTCPLRTPGDVMGCLELMERTDADTVITVADINKYHPMGMWCMKDDMAMEPYSKTERAGYNRQNLKPVYWRTGSVYVMRRDVLLEKNVVYGDKVYGYVVNESRSWFNIDSDFDLQLTEAWLRDQKHKEQTA
jgi:CMP-N,N'-diacetyllegionaminic acid synthase